MAKVKTIYPLKGIFTNFLIDGDKHNFIIPTYQRGYKWTSLDGKGQVNILLKDLFNAFKSNHSRYYLQFLTLKEKNEELEVIDGQQRLTTLTILFCVLAHIDSIDPEENFVHNKLKYETRQNFVQQFIYNGIAALLESENWHTFVTAYPGHDNQDVFFIYHAAKAIYAFLLEQLHEETKSFFTYLSNDVHLIINLLDAEMNSEKIFINVNKGVRLNDEDLVKGLLITKLPLDQICTKYRVTETEINEQRSNIGRQWDEIASWVANKEIRYYFKIINEHHHLEWLIRLSYPGVETDQSGHPLFNYFDNLYRNKKTKAIDIFYQIRKSKLLLNDWFHEPEISTLLGYLLHANKPFKEEFIWKALHQQDTKEKILQSLKGMCLSALPLNSTNDQLKELNYTDHRPELFNVFLMLDIVKCLPINKQEAGSYNFGKISSENWSIEHIFPQTARDYKHMNSLSEEDLKIIRELLPDTVEIVKIERQELRKSVIQLYKKIRQAKEHCNINDDERTSLEHLLNNNAVDLHTIGNLALLVSNMNTSLSNHYFDGKRKILSKKVSEGRFVPFHTYDVFSKLVIPAEAGLHVWSKNDIKTHESYIREQIVNVVNYLTPKAL